MIAKDGQPAELESQSNYEAAVLDFLDKEMADAQSTITEQEQTEELDALVADLLQQVMTESNQPKSSGEMMISSEDMNDLLAEFMPQPETVSLPESGSAPPPEAETVQAESISAGEDISAQEAVEQPVSKSLAEPTLDAKVSPAPAAALFASPALQKNRMPMIAAAIVCALAVIGIAIYYFSGPSGRMPTSEIAQAGMPAEPVMASQTAQASANPAAKSKDSRAVPPFTDKNSAPAGPKTPAPVAATQKPPVSNVLTPTAVPAANTFNPAPAKEETSAETQVAQSQPSVMPRTVPERSAPPVVMENPAPPSAVPDIKTAQLIAIAPANADNNAPAPALQAPAPVVQRNLIPAVAISQVSPKYPEIALRTRTSASVVLELDIDKQGMVIKATPVSGPAMFHKEAINAALQWRYRPASIGGTNVSSQVKVTFNFSLKK
jgi:TonB family protein